MIDAADVKSARMAVLDVAGFLAPRRHEFALVARGAETALLTGGSAYWSGFGFAASIPSILEPYCRGRLLHVVLEIEPFNGDELLSGAYFEYEFSTEIPLVVTTLQIPYRNYAGVAAQLSGLSPNSSQERVFELGVSAGIEPEVIRLSFGT